MFNTGAISVISYTTKERYHCSTLIKPGEFYIYECLTLNKQGEVE